MRKFSVMAVIFGLAVAAFAAPIHVAAWMGNVARLEAILQADPKLVDVIDPADNMTPLALAINGDKLEAVKFLLAHGANPNIEITDQHMGMGKITPFFLALKKANIEIIRALLDKGADVNKRYSPMQFTALHLMLMEGNASKEVLELLLQRGADAKAKMVIPPEALKNIPDDVKKLIDLPSFGTPLMFASLQLRRSRKNIDIEKLLVKYGALPLDAPLKAYIDDQLTRQQQAVCMAGLRELMTGESKYLAAHEQYFPWAMEWKKTVEEPKEKCPLGGFGFNVYLSCMKLDWITDPANVIVFADCKNPDGLIRSWDDIDTTRHGDGFCAVFLDGHASFVKADTLEMTTLPNGAKDEGKIGE